MADLLKEGERISLGERAVAGVPGQGQHVVDRQQPAERAFAIEDWKTAHAVAAHRLEGVREVIPLSAGIERFAHDVRHRELGRKALRCGQTHTDVAIGDHPDSLAVAYDRESSAFALLHQNGGCTESRLQRAAKHPARHGVADPHGPMLVRMRVLRLIQTNQTDSLDARQVSPAS